MSDFWADDFHLCAFLAFIEQAKAQQGWPDSQKTKERANRLYEERKRG